MFNNSQVAANAGIGLRYVRSLAWGINAYYDYRNTSHFHYNQVGAGLEIIGSYWSVNCNGYFPVGKRKSPFFDRQITGTGPLVDFGFFQGNQMFLQFSGDEVLTARQEFDFKGVDANFSICALKKGFFSLDVDIGPYYFKGQYNAFAAGGKGRVKARFSEVFTLAVSGSYDNLFHERFQGEVGLSLPLGRRSFGKRCAASSCAVPYFFDSQLARGANRNEIIVLDTHEKVLSTVNFSGNPVAINPDTGLPYYIVFVDNLSHSLGTFESPFPTVQQALALMPPAEAIYVYQGDGTPYDVDISLQDDQMLLGSGCAQVVRTTLGPITIPPQSVGIPTLKNTMGATMITLANRNTVSGFNLLVLSAGDTVVATTKQGLSFLNNIYSTAVTAGMNNLLLTDCSGNLLVQNNQFTMDPGGTGSFGILLSDAGSGTSALSVLNNTFTNHAATAINLTYNGSSSPLLNIGGNTITGASTPGANGIQINPASTAVVAGAITGNSCSNHLGANIVGFPTDSSSLSLTIADNILTGPAIVPGGSFPKGIQLTGNTSSTMNMHIDNNQINDHSDSGVNLYVFDAATVTATIDRNTMTVPDNLVNTVGIHVSAGNSSPVASTFIVTNNVCAGHTSVNIQSFFNNSSIVALTIAGNSLTGPAITPMGSNPTGIQVGISNSVKLNAMVNGQNRCSGHSFQGMSFSSSDSSELTAVINDNTVIASSDGANTSGIVANCNTSGLCDYTITNNSCTGHTNGCIQSFPSGSAPVTLNISNNTLVSAVDGILSTNPSGIQVGLSGTTQLLSGTISGNTWTGPHTYQTSTVPQGIQCGFGDSAIASNLTISGNTLVLPLTSYQANTGVTGIQVNTFNTVSLQGVVVSNNSVSYPISAYQDSTSLQGIQVQAGNTSSLTQALISNNTVTFAPLTTVLANFSSNGVSVSSGDNSTFGTGALPIIVQQNTVTGSEGNGINSFGGSTIDSQINILNNSLLLGAVNQSFGIFSGAGGSGKIKILISDNTVEGNNGAFFGILALNLGPVCQDVTIQNNTVTNVHGNNPIIPGPPPGGGIGVLALSSGNMNGLVKNNALSGNTPQGLFVVDSATLGGTGTLCLTVQDNHGAAGHSPDGYTFSNPTMASPSTFIYNDAGGNAGVFSFSPSMADFMPGTCSSCP